MINEGKAKIESVIEYLRNECDEVVILEVTNDGKFSCISTFKDNDEVRELLFIAYEEISGQSDQVH